MATVNGGPVPANRLAGFNASAHGDNKKAAVRARFEGVFAQIREECLDYFKSEGMAEDAIDWFRRNLDYNVPGGKLNRGLSVTDSVEILKGRPLTEEEYTKSAILGWCIELLQAFFLVSDDMMDQSITRRSQPCWYRVKGVGTIAINDSFLLEGAIYFLLKKHFRRETYYVDLLELFHDTTFQTEMGQLVDLITAPEDEVDLSKFSLEKHSFIVRYKTAFYSFNLPVALAMRMCHIPNSSSPSDDPYKLALDILLPLGEYFQVQDDFLDYSAPPEQLGKIGTDIVDNKCSWCINVALKHASPEQRKILDENYGVKPSGGGPEARIKQIYKELGIPEKYAKYEEEVVGEIKKMIEKVPQDNAPSGDNVGTKENPAVLKREVFQSFLSKIYKRTK